MGKWRITFTLKAIIRIRASLARNSSSSKNTIYSNAIIEINDFWIYQQTSNYKKIKIELKKTKFIAI